MDESMACTSKAEMRMEKLDVEVAAEKAEAAAAVSAAEHLRKAEDAALARLDGLVAGGAIDSSMIAEIRERRSSAPQSRLLAIVQDAAALIEAGRIAHGHQLAIQLPPPADVRMPRPGSMGAELVFVDAKTSRVVARIAPITKEQFGTKNGDIEELLKWAAEDPERRDLEFVVVSSGFIDGRDVAPLDAFEKGLGALKESGLDERRMISVDGHAMTPGEWIKNPDPFQKELDSLTQGELDEGPLFPLVGKEIKGAR